MCISPCRLMNIWIYLHKACTKLLQLTVIGWTITLLSKMAGEGFFFLSFFWSNISLFIFDLHMYCDDMQINWDWLFFFVLFFFLFVVVTGCLKCTVPCPSWCAGSGSRCQNCEPDPNPGLGRLRSSGWLLTTERGSEPGGGCRGGSH